MGFLLPLYQTIKKFIQTIVHTNISVHNKFKFALVGTYLVHDGVHCTACGMFSESSDSSPESSSVDDASKL